ncbi:MAG: Glycosyl transferase family 2 [Candidatus Gottesmanbacteria bacterium GW2011_GWA1_34_13]|uniref:Glycosyl transferase family 2 n=1 Tax=Candidatus Gottesmanbacteria bacterium GW2011_GWA1_34_13 TaxID=1618434 RepID=A0A0G0D9M3_9BACT|nr:MAG: Glycosyl transferase family 2 [Candidatus Gottesmanbacteria bacterium GW2011_GWA1_34_13]
MDKKIDLSVIIITKNEAENIGDCIKSVKQLEPQEILVIDDNSSDETREIALKQNVKICLYQKKDFADIRNYGAKQANCKWILYIDADERLTPEIVINIKDAIQNDSFSAYKICRLNYYLGKKWPRVEYLERLMQKSKLNYWFGQVHETPNISGKIGTISGQIEHFTHKSITEMVANTIIWSKIEANLRFQAKHPKISWWRIPRVMIPVFWEYYLNQGGWKVGTVGLIESIYQAFSIFITYARLWEMQQNQNN